MGNCERLKWNRRKMRLTQKELANKAGLSSATIGRLEQDETHWEIITDEIPQLKAYCEQIIATEQ